MQPPVTCIHAAALLLLAALLSACTTPEPLDGPATLRDPVGAFRDTFGRIDRVDSLESPIRLILTTDQQRADLRGELVLAAPDRLRLRLRKFNTPLLDLTVDGDRRHLLATDDFNERAGGAPDGAPLRNPTARSRGQLGLLADALLLAVAPPAAPRRDAAAADPQSPGDAIAADAPAGRLLLLDPREHVLRLHPLGAGAADAPAPGTTLALDFDPAAGGRGRSAPLVLRTLVAQSPGFSIELRVLEPVMNQPPLPGAFTAPAEAEPLG